MMNKIKISQIGINHEHAPGKMVSLKRLPDLFEIVGVLDDRIHINTTIWFRKCF
jgi:hypothetical protein